MGHITIQQAAAWCGGQYDPKYADVTFFGASNDTRTIQPGQLFVALKSARDGHDFVPMALQKGAGAILCQHCDGDYPAIVVEDTRIALGKIANGERHRLGMQVVGVTGSVGKSTTKEMIATVLSTTFRTAKTPANHNNDIGMPMGILAMAEGTQVAVLEMGMNHFREMAYLSAVGQPDLAVIVNIGTMHIEHLGTREGILRAKLEILEGMEAKAPILLNGDDDLLSGADCADHPVTCFGLGENAAVRGSDVILSAGQTALTVRAGEESFRLELPVEGAHFVPDALAAVAVGLALGVAPVQIKESLAAFQNMAGRQEIYEKDGYTIISDCYNAGPESMAAALKVLGRQPGRKIAVLGDMLELGSSTQAEHYKVGRIAAEEADYLLAYGPSSVRMQKGAITGGMLGGRAMSFEDQRRLVLSLKLVARPGDVLLFKGSRGMRMEKILEAFFTEET